MSVKLDEIMIYWERIAPYAARNNHTPLRGEQQATVLWLAKCEKRNSREESEWITKNDSAIY